MRAFGLEARLFALAVVVAPLAGPGAVQGQEPEKTTVHVSALPAIDYSSDDGLGYGALGGVYGYRGDERGLYRWSFEPSVFFTTRGRREAIAVFDAPSLIAANVRITVLAAFERDCCYPYFGLGNATPYDPALRSPATGPNYYTYTRRRLSAVATVQWTVHSGVRLLAGVAAYHNRATSRGVVTLFARDSAAGVIRTSDFSALSIGPKVGVVLDTRDRERDPHHGVWLEGLAWATGDFARYSATARGYAPLAPPLTLAGRIMAEVVRGAIPITMLPDMASSFRDFQGLGGGKSIRGVAKTRFLGTSRGLVNLELRWRAGEFRAAGQRWTPGLVAFTDGGRVWKPDAGTGSKAWHWGHGAGARLTLGEAFMVALDFGKSSESGLSMYLGLGHLF